MLEAKKKLFNNDSVGVLIGNFQPFNNRHMAIINEAVSNGIQSFRFLVCGATSPRSPRRPFTYRERVLMIWDVLTANDENRRALVVPEVPPCRAYGTTGTTFFAKINGKPCYFEFVDIRDHLYNDTRWVSGVLWTLSHPTRGLTDSVLLGDDCHKHVRELHETFPELRVHLTGDDTSYKEDTNPVSSTVIRNLFFNKKYESNFKNRRHKQLMKMVPERIEDQLAAFYTDKHDIWTELCNDTVAVNNRPKQVGLQVMVILQKDNRVLRVRRNKVDPKTLEYVDSVHNKMYGFPTCMVTPDDDVIETALLLVARYTSIGEIGQQLDSDIDAIRAGISSTSFIGHTHREDDNFQAVQVVHIRIPNNIGFKLSPCNTTATITQSGGIDTKISTISIHELMLPSARMDMKFDHYDIAELFF